MGAVQKATPEMGEWHTEVRRESAYLYAGQDELPNADPDHAIGVLRSPTPPPHPEVEWALAMRLPKADLPKVLAAVDQILAHPPYEQFAANNEVAHGVWSAGTPVHEAGEWVEFEGPFIATGPNRQPWALQVSIELAYENLADLRERIAETIG